MKTMARCLLVLVVMIVLAAPAYSAPPAQSAPQAKPAAPAHSAAPAKLRDVVHIFQCNIVSGTATEAQVEADVLEMLRATRATPGGEKVTAKVFWPVAVNNMGETDFNVLVISPTFSAWGKLWDASRDPDSPLGKWEAAVQKSDQYECTDSAIWESVVIEEK
jgi:hypothetical protein